MISNSELEMLITDFYDMGYRILKIKGLIHSLENENLVKHYQKQLDGLFEDYDLMTELLKTELKAQLERSDGSIDLRYRRIYKSLNF